jgi:hypothetical protein
MGARREFARLDFVALRGGFVRFLAAIRNAGWKEADPDCRPVSELGLASD